MRGWNKKAMEINLEQAKTSQCDTSVPAEQEKLIQEELYDCSIQSAELDKRMQDIRNMIIKANGDGEE